MRAGRLGSRTRRARDGAELVRNLDDDETIDDAHPECGDGEVGRQGQRLAGAHIELGPVPRTHDHALVGLEVALRERAVIVAAAILDRMAAPRRR